MSANEHKKDLRIDSVLDIIETDLAGDLSIRSLAKRAFLSYSHLAHLFKQELGTSVAGYVRKRRVQEAMRLLSSTTIPIKQVAQDVGLTTSSRLARMLKAEVGCTPSLYRKREQKPVTKGKQKLTTNTS